MPSEPDPPHTPIYISQTFEKFGYPLTDWEKDAKIWNKVIHEDDREWAWTVRVMRWAAAKASTLNIA